MTPMRVAPWKLDVLPSKPKTAVSHKHEIISSTESPCSLSSQQVQPRTDPRYQQSWYSKPCVSVVRRDFVFIARRDFYYKTWALPHLWKQANLSTYFMSSPDFMNSWTLPTSSGKDTYQNSRWHMSLENHPCHMQDTAVTAKKFLFFRYKNQGEPSHKQETWLTTATVQQLRLRHARVTLCLAPRYLARWISRWCRQGQLPPVPTQTWQSQSQHWAPRVEAPSSGSTWSNTSGFGCVNFNGRKASNTSSSRSVVAH